MKKRNWLFYFSVVLFIHILVLLPNCSTSSPNDSYQRFELNVLLGEGATGTPATGTYPYEEGDVVDYSYSLLPNYSNLTVELDDVVVEPTGSIIITGVHNLNITATPVYDIKGKWSLQEEYDDGSSFSVTATFTGTLESGTVIDSDGGSGTYTVSDNNVVEFNLVYPNVTYEYSGYFDDANTMKGDSERIIGSDTYFGAWSATRDTEAAPKASLKTKNKINFRRER
jgi:hypothetical protein